jgi:hypothetical protein
MTEREAVRLAQKVGAGEPDLDEFAIREALATLALANRVHMQQLKGRVEDLEDSLTRIVERNDLKPG